jgi:hypothetical protein
MANARREWIEPVRLRAKNEKNAFGHVFRVRKVGK